MAVVASVLFDGSSNGNGSVVELEGGEYVWFNSGDIYEEGEEYDESYSTIEQRDLSDVSLENIVFSSWGDNCLLYTSPSPRDSFRSRMPSSA